MSAEKPIKLGPSATMDSRQSPPVAPFDRSKMADDEPQFDVNPFTPRHKGTDAPPPAQGIDLTGQNKIIFAVGRGKTGKTRRWCSDRQGWRRDGSTIRPARCHSSTTPLAAIIFRRHDVRSRTGRPTKLACGSGAM